MRIPDNIRTFLVNSGLKIRVRTAKQPAATLEESAASAAIPSGVLVRAVALRAGRNPLVAILPADCRPDYSALAEHFGHPPVLCGDLELRRLFPHCDVAALPPLPEAFGFQAVVDPSIQQMEKVFFASGRVDTFLYADRDDFLALQGDFLLMPLTAEISNEESAQQQREAVKHIGRMPTMPGMALEILAIRSNPFAQQQDLARVIERDPSLSAQLIRYARSPFYAYRGEVESVEQAIVHVLGAEFAQHMALGIALGRGFRIPRGGPIGLDAYWHHSVYCAALVQALAAAMRRPHRPSRGMAWLAGLLHNFGLLLLGHAFRADYDALAAAIQAEPETPLPVIERRVLAVSHSELGRSLMEAWRLPPEVIEAAAYHHAPDLAGPDAVYAQLVHLANRLLRSRGIGDEVQDEDIAGLCARLDLTVEAADKAAASALQDEAGLGWIAATMAA